MDKKVSAINRFPNYSKIYKDLIELKYPDKEVKCKALLQKKALSILDVIKLNDLLFRGESDCFNQKLRSYDEIAILEILQYQKVNQLNNTEVAFHFKLSRNTITKWKKYFQIRFKFGFSISIKKLQFFWFVAFLVGLKSTMESQSYHKLRIINIVPIFITNCENRLNLILELYILSVFPIYFQSPSLSLKITLKNVK